MLPSLSSGEKKTAIEAGAPPGAVVSLKVDD
jgi:hypothetical protein